MQSVLQIIPRNPRVVHLIVTHFAYVPHFIPTGRDCRNAEEIISEYMLTGAVELNQSYQSKQCILPRTGMVISFHGLLVS